jgi:hypothetical protein
MVPPAFWLVVAAMLVGKPGGANADRFERLCRRAARIHA